MMKPEWAVPRIHERQIVQVLFACWLAFLLGYVWVVRPWQHYDEPTHFEYALLIRELGRLPTIDEHIPTLRRAIAASMLEHGFYNRPDLRLPAPDLDSSTLTLGVNERSVPPTYYILVALATWPVRNWSITAQLYASRLVSVALALCLFGAAYALLRLLTGADWPLRCWALAALIVQPTFADTMSAVSSDALANLAAVLILLAGTWFLQRPGWLRLLPLLGAALFALGTKRTLIPMLGLLPIALFLVAPRRIRIGVLLTSSVLLLTIVIALLIPAWPLASWSGSASSGGYVRAGGPPISAATVMPQVGQAAFALSNTAATPIGELHQDLPLLAIQRIVGQQVTLSAWMRSDQPGLRATTPALQIDSQIISQSVTLDRTWRFVAFTTSVPAHADNVAVVLRGPIEHGLVGYDSVALVQGDSTAVPNQDAPDSSFAPGLLGSEPAANLLRNSGAERRVPPLPTVLRLLSGRLIDEAGFADVLATASDPAWIAAVYPFQLLLLFVSAWGAFGWGEVSVPVGWFMPLGLITLAAVVGAMRFTFCACKAGQIEGSHWRLHAWALCLGAVGIAWGAALVRVHSQPFPGAMFWSFGRYTFVALTPALLILAVGLREITPTPLRTQVLAGVLIFLLIFALVAFFGTVLPV